MSETIDGSDLQKENTTNSSDDLITMSNKLIDTMNIKMSIFLFVFGILIFSDVFTENFLTRFAGTIDGLCTTTKGTVIQLIFLIMGYLIMDVLMKSKIL